MDKQLYFDIHNILEQSVSDCYVRYFMDELAIIALIFHGGF